MPYPKQIDHAPLVVESIHGKDWEKILKQGTDKMLLPWQLGYGTLLGAVREPDKYIHHEIDLDVDVMITKHGEEKLIPEMHESFLRDGFYLLRTQMFDNLFMSAAFLHRETRIIFDICYFYQFWGDDYLHLGTGGIAVRPSYTYKSKKIKIKSNNYYIPEKAEDYLEGRYGSDWRTPKKKSNWNEYGGRYLIPLK